MPSSTRPRSGLKAVGRLGDPPLRVRWNFVGVDALIDPPAKRPKGRRAARRSAPTGAAHFVGVDVLIDPSAKRPKGRRAARRSAPTGAVHSVGVDALIDPSAKRPKGRRCKKPLPGGQCHLVSGIECRATPEKNECIRQRMHFFWKKCMTRERIAKSAKKAIQNGRFMLLYK